MHSHEFKVGDRVRYTGRKSGWETSRLVGDTGIVIGQDGQDCIRVDFVKNPDATGGVFSENLELITEAPPVPVVPAGPFYVFAVPPGGYDTMEAATEAAHRYAKNGSKYGIFTGLKAFMLPTAIQEVPFAP